MGKTGSNSKGRGITDQQERFCQLYTKYWNATRSAKEAGYSEKSAAKLGYDLLQNTLVLKRIDELKEYALKEIGISRERVLQELSYVATYDIGLAFDEMGQMKPLSEIPEEVRRCISSIEVHELFDGQGPDKTVIGLAKKIRFSDKLKASELIGKHLKLFADRVEHSGPDGAPIPVASLSKEERQARIDELLAKAKERKKI